MWRNKIVFLILIIFIAFNVGTEVYAADTNATQPAKTTIKTPDNKKKLKLNFEDELVTGNYEAPDALFMNSRRLIKYKELFNKRTNFIEEIESNKGLFNEHQK